ncbi:carbohydrate ABC transporter permease [Neobacillus vireti]|uniref:Binding-protein-dependent transport system inner membrane protein n=1 Tax=Neobacillus vireti LMG 21834 TaxID=1131730 RepID=A0AB94IT76_9BACI|nr:sugar ABC transporter permease [Neobacillus vireti]ETI70178.1 binding-protein-dependent transport system inner membrane protein [Neobacillus vireti LMG 21834]KLT16455.1 sugar ABC transporter permease [Neobacillus vireti]
MGNRRYLNFQGYSFMMPALLAILFFTIVPVVYAFFMMFYKVDILSGARTFIGLDNFRKIFEDPKFWASFTNTFRYVLVVVPIQTVIAMALAALLNSKINFSRGFLTIMFIPTLTSSSAMTLIFMWLFNNNGLMANMMEQLFGMKVEFLTNPSLALTVIMAMNIFSTVPHFMVVFLSGLQDIPDSLYEAASLDGANSFKKFLHVTVPQLMPITFYVITMGLVGCFQIFDQAFILSGGTGGPQNSTLTFSLYIYQLAFTSNDMGRATALAFVLGTIIFAVTYIVNKLLKADEVNG